MLKSLKLHAVGPVRELSADFGDRLNVITGDNGLGKSFLLDLCFWVLTGTWPGRRMALPDSSAKAPKIAYEIKSKTKAAVKEASYPFNVKDDWFEIQLPSLQLVLTPAVPARQQNLAAFTLERLGLRDSEVIVRYRQTFFELYREAKLTIEGLNEVAPLIAAAVQRDLTNGVDWRR